MASPNDTISEQDRAARLLEEAQILSIANDLASGDRRNPTPEDYKHEGMVRKWMVEKTIDQGMVLREIAESLPGYQTVADCEGLHQAKTWPVKVFGTAYSAPVTLAVGIIGIILGLFCRKQGWI